MAEAGTIDVSALARVSPLIQSAPRRSPRLSKRPISSAAYPLFTAYAIASKEILSKEILGHMDGKLPKARSFPALSHPGGSLKITRRRKDVASVPWDPDDFNGQRKSTWAPQMPRRKNAVPKPVLGGGSFKTASAVVDATEEMRPSGRLAAEEVTAAKHGMPTVKRSRIHTDPTHKRDVEVKSAAFGWGQR